MRSRATHTLLGLRGGLPRLATALRSPAADLLALAAVAFVIEGVKLIYLPAGWIVGGLFLFVLALVLGRRPGG